MFTPCTTSAIQISPALDLRNLKLKAVSEVGLQHIDPSFDYPVIPTSGYRKCLEHNWYENIPRKSEIVYIGTLNEICKGCLALNMTQSFEELSFEVCTSQELICGFGSGLICGLLGFSTKTFVQIDPNELKTWPKYMNDFDYSGRYFDILENNHRLVFDRHTIKVLQFLIIFPYCTESNIECRS